MIVAMEMVSVLVSILMLALETMRMPHCLFAERRRTSAPDRGGIGPGIIALRVHPSNFGHVHGTSLSGKRVSKILVLWRSKTATAWDEETAPGSELPLESGWSWKV